MKPIRTLVVTTLVIAAAISAPEFSQATKTRPSPEDIDQVESESEATPDEIHRARLLDLSPAPPLPPTKFQNDFVYKYRHTLAARAGVRARLSDPSNPDSLLSLLYWFPLRNLRGAEIGADLDGDGTGALHFAARWTIGDGKWRWLYKFGGGIRIVPSDQLVTFLRLKHWQARIGGGFEYLVSDPFGLRVDLEGLATTEYTACIATLGATWAW